MVEEQAKTLTFVRISFMEGSVNGRHWMVVTHLKWGKYIVFTSEYGIKIVNVCLSGLVEIAL